MNLEKRIEAFVKLGNRLSEDIDKDLMSIIRLAQVHNPWFTENNCMKSLRAWGKVLTRDNLEKWIATYSLNPSQKKKVGIIMAGNIPLVGFHDLLSVVLSGHMCIVKMSSQDDVLMKSMIDYLLRLLESGSDHLAIVDQLKSVDAVIATGSDNSARYFEYYFGKYPNIIRKNRTSVAIIVGNETEEELLDLGRDVFTYFGLGCRNVSKLFFPKGYEIKRLLDLWNEFAPILDHNKYRNNYDYHKSILLVNKEDHLDTGFALLRETQDLVSPLSVIYYQYYEDFESLLDSIAQQDKKIQCTVCAKKSQKFIAPGQTQEPELWDYADGVDTLKFLDQL